MTGASTMLATVLRGLRSRTLLSAGSVLLTALAIGSAVLGPIFQEAVTNSYVVTRLNEAPNNLTGLTWVFAPDGSFQGRPGAALQRADEASAERETGPFAAPQPQLQTHRFRVESLQGEARLLAKDDVCDHVDLVAGACPTAADEMLMLVGDLERNGLAVGDVLDLGPVGEKTVVGGYRVPEDEDDYWFDPSRLASIPRMETASRTVIPYQPAPFLVTTEAFEDLRPATWEVLVDRRLDVPPDSTLATLERAEAAAERLARPPVKVDGGRLGGSTINDLRGIAAEVRGQQETARASIAPAVVSLVLVAMALLLRLLMAAAELRLPELALASLRGLSRRQLWGLGLSEPLALLVLSIPVGTAVGMGMALGLVRWWLVPGLPLPVPWMSALSGLLVVVAALGVAILATSLVLRVSLSEQLTGVRRPRSSGRASVIAQLALVAAAVAVLASKLSGGGPGRPDVTDLVLPVLLAVVAGIAATRATALLATWWTRRRTRTRSLPGFVASRAISRRQEGTLVILPVTAAIAICVFGAGVYDSAASWRASVAATSAPAENVWLSPMPLNETVALTHELDPEGDYLMAASTISTLGPTFVVVDAPRLENVSAWPDQWTPGLGPGRIAADLDLAAEVPVVTGRRVAITVDNRAEVDDDLHVRLRLDVLGGRPHFIFLGPFPSGESTRSLPAPYCREGCRFDGITLGGPAVLPIRINGTVRISDVTVDGAPVPGAIDGAGWGTAPFATGAEMITGVTSADGVVSVEAASGGSKIIVQLAAGSLPERLPAVRGVDASVEVQGGSARTSLTEFEVEPVHSAQSVPFLGPNGLMIDYTTLTTARQIYPQDTPVRVLARGDTPASITEGLRDRGASLETTLAGVQKTLDQGAYALALRLYAVVALLVLLMAMAGLFVSTAVQLPARRRDAASLRVVGVPRRSVMSAVLRELAVVLGSTAIAGLAAGTLAQYVVLRTVTLGVVDEVATPALVAAIDGQRLVLLAGAAGLVFGLVALASAALTVRGARGSTLRENSR